MIVQLHMLHRKIYNNIKAIWKKILFIWGWDILKDSIFFTLATDEIKSSPIYSSALDKPKLRFHNKFI